MDFEYYGNIDEKTINKSKELQERYNFNKVRLMPDAHYSDLVPVGFVAEMNKPVPKLITPDIGCGVTTKMFKIDKDFKLNDKVFKNIRNRLDYREQNRTVSEEYILDLIYTPTMETIERLGIDKEHFFKQFGQIGGGNHFAEIGIKDNKCFITVHSGSRNFGFKVWKYWSEYVKKKNHIRKFEKDYINNIKLVKSGEDIEKSIKKFNSDFRDFEYLIDYKDIKMFMADIYSASKYAEDSRKSTINAILDEIAKENDTVRIYSDSAIDSRLINSEHNMYYMNNSNSYTLRKGAIYDKFNDLMTIPMNMKEGILIYRRLNNYKHDYMNSAPHGLGRIMSRTEAKNKLKETDLIQEMKGINSNSDKYALIDESPKAYKNSEEFKKIMSDNFEIIYEVPPVFNYKVTN